MNQTNLPFCSSF